MNPYYHITKDEENEYQKAHEEHIENMLNELFRGLDIEPSEEDFESDY